MKFRVNAGNMGIVSVVHDTF